jgi:hypothetical protein
VPADSKPRYVPPPTIGFGDESVCSMDAVRPPDYVDDDAIDRRIR